MIPSDDQISKDAEALGFSEPTIARLHDQAKCARAGTSLGDGYKSTHGAAGGGRPSGISDPTGDMVVRAHERTDEIEKQHALLFDMLTQAAASKRAAFNTLERCEALQKPDKTNGQTATQCCEETCTRPAAKGERGRCHSCYCWLLANKNPDGTWKQNVPPELIAEREKTHKRRHVA